MAADGEAEQNALLRGIIASVVAGSGTELPQAAGGTDSVAQLIAAAMTQLGHNIISLQENIETQEESEETQNTVSPEQEAIAGPPNDDFSFNPEVAESPVGGAPSQVEEKKSGKLRPICVKLPIETRKRIIAMRKEGKKCKEIAKELKVSVSGAEKVWERFLATGKVHDRKPSEYAGRPRKPLAFAQGSGAGSPSTRSHHVHIGDTVEVSQDDAHSIEYTTVIGESSDPPTAAEDAVVISEDGDIYVGGPLDMPGATVEIVETEPIAVSAPSQRKTSIKKKPEYREQLLLRLVEGCPLAALREGTAAEGRDNPHIINLATSITRPLYMESVLGHPFGRVPLSRPFDANQTEAEIILSDPANPVGKDLIAALGYSTAVYFNACCKPSPLFDPNKVLSSLPFYFEAGYLADNTQKVLQLFLDLSKDPFATLECLPEGNGPALTIKTSDGRVLTRKSPSPKKLSEYWSSLYKYASLLECCENFLSASLPSAPCLLCHPFEKLAQTLEIKDQEEAELVPSSLAHSLSPSSETVHRQTVDSLTHHIEVQVLESGQVAMTSTAVTFGPNTEPTPVVAQDTLSVVQDSRVRTPPTVQSNTQSRKASSAGGRRRRSNGSSCSNRGDEVEVDGQFDMPIPESSTAGVVSSTGSNTVMTFVTTSEELNQTTPQEEEHSQPSLSGGHGGGAPVSQQLASSSCTPLHTLAACTKTPPPALTATLTIEPVKQVSVDASTQTMNGRLRSEVQDRTPLIIRRSRAGKVKKLTAPLTTQQQLTTPDATVRLSTGNGNETGTQTHQAVQVQTQSPSEIEATSVETEAPIDEQGQSFTHTPRRSTRKSAHKVSPSEPVTTAKTSSPSRRMSPRKSPVETTTVSPKRIQTRAVAKRAVQLEEVDAPPAKRTRKAVLQRRKDSEEDEVKHPQEWGVDEVAEYISSIQKDCAGVFKEHEVDGESLLSLNPEMMVRLMNLKTGPALKIHRKITALKRQYGSRPSSALT